MGRKWWDETRRAAYAQNGYRCWACNAQKQRLEAHEVYKYNYEMGSAKLVEVCALCYTCHSFIHSGRLMALYEKGEISEREYNRITDHGMRILREHHLVHLYQQRHSIDENKFAAWEKWHILIDGVKHFGQFKNIGEWAEYHGYETTQEEVA
jgi:hypothetical protein